MKRERKINISYLFFDILVKWKLILIVSIICAMAGAGYAVLKHKTENGAGQIEQEIAVTEEEFSIVRSVIEAYDMAETQKEYNEQCIWRKCNYLSKGVACATYRIWSETELKINQIAALYSGIFENDVIYETISANQEENMEGKYIKEGISCTIPVSGIVQIEVVSYTKEKAQEWLKEIISYLDSQKSVIADRIGNEYGIELIYQSLMENVDTELAERQIELNEKLETLEANYNMLLETLSANQAEYFTLYLQAREDLDYDEGQPLIKNSQISSEEQKNLLIRRLKIDSIMAFLLGGFIACVFCIFRYCYSSRLTERDDFETMYGLAVLGCFSENISVKKLILWIREKKGKKYIQKDIMKECEEIIARICIQIPEGTKIYITGTQIEEKYMELLKKEGHKRNISISGGKSILDSSKTLTEIKDFGTVLFMEKENMSKYSEIEEEIVLCEEADKKILGVVVME